MKVISSKTSLSSNTMTTTISKHEVQQQQQHQQQHQQQLQQVIATTATRSEPQPNAAIDTLNNNNDIDDGAGSVAATGLKGQKRRSLLNFKSFDFHIKSLYSGLRTPGHALAETPPQTNAAAAGSRASLGGTTTTAGAAAAAPGAAGAARPTPPHLRIEAVDTEPEREEGSNLLLDYGQSPYTPRRNSSTQLLSINRYSSACATLSPYLLSPYMQVPGGGAAGGSTTAVGDSSGGSIRRSSTSDIVARRGSTASGANSRRPSTSDLLRRARERRGSEARMGRSVSHSAMGRSGAGGGGGSCMGGRRTSMAF